VDDLIAAGEDDGDVERAGDGLRGSRYPTSFGERLRRCQQGLRSMHT